MKTPTVARRTWDRLMRDYSSLARSLTGKGGQQIQNTFGSITWTLGLAFSRPGCGAILINRTSQEFHQDRGPAGRAGSQTLVTIYHGGVWHAERRDPPALVTVDHDSARHLERPGPVNRISSEAIVLKTENSSSFWCTRDCVHQPLGCVC